MSEWKEYKLGDFIKVKHGFAFKGDYITTDKTSNILVTPGNFNIGGGFKDDKLKYYSNYNFPKEYILKGGDIVVTMTDLSKDSDTLGYSAKIPYSKNYNYLHNQRIGLVQFIREDICQDFIYWLMRTREYQNYIVSSASGTSIMHTSPSRIEDYRCMFPSLEEQKRIASILSSLDDKIDLLHRENATLEAMAETLFRQWFIEEAKEDWKEVLLDDIAFLSAGGDKPKRVSQSCTEDCNVPIYSNGIENEGLYGYTDIPKIVDESVTISARGTIGYVVLRIEPFVPIVRLITLIPKECVTSKYLYYLLKNQNIEGTGTTQQQLTVPDFKQMKVLLPEKVLIDRFTNEVNVYYDKILENKKNIGVIIQMRDKLLKYLY